ncbi:Hypothetical protein D9617_20g026910 [Elsinoe fawcettii]|nr:Hypothetical protein D9617_20g026910 [Elsinoe fawcettii]
MELSLTGRDIEILSAAMLCNKQQVDLDWPNFQRITGLTEGSAKTIWYKLQKKIREADGSSAAVIAKSRRAKATSTTATEPKNRGKKAKTKDLQTNNTASNNKRAVEEEEDASDTPPPKKRVKKTQAVTDVKSVSPKDEPHTSGVDTSTSDNADASFLESISDVASGAPHTQDGFVGGVDDGGPGGSSRGNPADYGHWGYGSFDTFPAGAGDHMGESPGS